MKKLISIISLMIVLIIASYNKLAAQESVAVNLSESANDSRQGDAANVCSPWLIFLNDRCLKFIEILSGDRITSHINTSIKISNN